MANAGVVLKHVHVTELDIREGFFSPETNRENEGKGRVCARCGLALSNYRIMMTGADVATRDIRC